MKLNIKKISIIICMMLLVIIIFVPTSHVFGEISTYDLENGTADHIKGFFSWMLKIGTGPLTSALAGLMNAIIVMIFMLLYFLFSPISAGFAFPFPDQIIFNKVGFFDPNFINPTSANNAPVNILQGLIKNLYYTGFVIAGAVFVIAAMVIGIKLAMSTIASEKAHYKQALVTWITGICLLFTTHFIMLAVFTVNEQVVKTVSESTEDIPFTFQWTEAIPFVGKTVTNLLNAVTGLVNLFPGVDIDPLGQKTVYGYSGLLIKFAAAALRRGLGI